MTLKEESSSVSPKTKSILNRVVPITFYLLLGVFLVLYLQSIDFSKLDSITISWGYVIIASIISLGFRYWGAYIWFVILKSLGAKNLNDVRGLLYVYAKSWLGRYIPGTAPWILGKIYFASKHGISKNKLAVSSLLEGLLQIVIIMAIAFGVLLLDTRLSSINLELRIFLTATLIGCLVLLIPAVFNKVIAVLYKIIRKKNVTEEHRVDNKTVAKGAGLYFIGSIVNAVSFFFIAKAIYPEISTSDFLFIVGVTNLANAASMLAFFAPSGIGVREGIQIALLSIIMPTEFALVISVVIRLWSIVLDLIFFGLAYTMHKYPFHTPPKNVHK